MRRRWIFPLLAIALSASVVLLLGEITLRVLGWSKPYYTFHPQIGYKIRPDSGYKLPVGEEGGTRWLQSNALGLRDVEHDYQKPDRVRRVLVLGDSFCEATQVDLDQTFIRILEGKLNSVSDEPRYEFINTGVNGYGTDRELLFFRHEGIKYSPDTVLLMFVFNDVRNNDRPMQLRTYGYRNEPYFLLEDGVLNMENFPAERDTWSRIKATLGDHLYLYHFVWKLSRGAALERKAVRAGGGGVPHDYHAYEVDYSPEWERAWEITTRLIDQLNQEVRAAGAGLVVVAVTNDLQVHEDHLRRMVEEYPAMNELEWDWLKPNHILAEFCERKGIEFVDLLGGFRATVQEKPEEYLHTFVGHWNAAGHELTAELLFDYFTRREAEDAPPE